MSIEHISDVHPEYLNSHERKRIWIDTAVKTNEVAESLNIPLLFRGSIHAEFLQPGFISDGYKEKKNAWRDLDLLLLGEPDTETVEQLNQASGDIPLGFGANEYIQFAGEGVNLVYKELQVPVDPSLFEPQYLQYGDKSLPFLDPLVHYHLFETVGFGGIFGPRMRDRKKMELYQNTPSRYSELSEEKQKQLFTPFYEYRRLRNKQYPIPTVVNKLRGDIPAPSNKYVREASRRFFRSINATPLPEELVIPPECINVSLPDVSPISQGKEAQVVPVQDISNTNFALKAYIHEDTFKKQLETVQDVRDDIDEFHSLGLNEQIPQTDFFIAENPQTHKPRLYALQPWVDGATLKDTNPLQIFNDDTARKSLSDLLIAASKYQGLFGFMPDTVGAHGMRISGKRIPTPMNLVPFFSNNIMIGNDGYAHFIDPHVRKTSDAQGKFRAMIQSASTRATVELLKSFDEPAKNFENPEVQAVKEYLESFSNTNESFPNEYFRDESGLKKKLLVVTNYPPGQKLNGLDFTVRMLLRYLAVNNTESILLTSSDEELDVTDEKLGRIIAIPGQRFAERLPGISINRKPIHDVINREQPEGVILFNPLVLGQQVASAAAGKNIPVIATADTRIGQYLRYQQLPGPIGKTLAHRIDYIDHEVKRRLPVQKWVAPSISYRKKLEDSGVQNVVTINREGSYGKHAKVERDTQLRQLIAPNGEFVLLNVGKIADVKNIRFLARVARLLDESHITYKMVFAGGNNNQKEFDALKNQFSPEKVMFLGNQNDERLLRLYGVSDLCLQPSNTETLGLVAIESLTAGLPVIAANSIGNRDTIRHEENGYLLDTTEPGDANTWAKRIQELIEKPERLEELKSHAIYPSYVAQSWKEYAREMVGLFAHEK